MAILPATTYKNTNRVATGIIHVRTDDDTINCDTVTGVCNVYLNEFVASYWNNQYKLYVNDYKGNAATNNITIYAPTGYTINNANSVVINVNGGNAIVRISSNNKYTATTNYCCGGGSSKDMSYYVSKSTYVADIVPIDNNKPIDTGISITTSNETSLTGVKYLVNVICNNIRIIAPKTNDGSLFLILRVCDDVGTVLESYSSKMLLFSDYSASGNLSTMHINYVPETLIKQNYIFKVYVNCASISGNVEVKYESSKLQISALRLGLL